MFFFYTWIVYFELYIAETYLFVNDLHHQLYKNKTAHQPTYSRNAQVPSSLLKNLQYRSCDILSNRQRYAQSCYRISAYCFYARWNNERMGNLTICNMSSRRAYTIQHNTQMKSSVLRLQNTCSTSTLGWYTYSI